jgi:hypothetical protein
VTLSHLIAVALLPDTDVLRQTATAPQLLKQRFDSEGKPLSLELGEHIDVGAIHSLSALQVGRSIYI